MRLAISMLAGAAALTLSGCGIAAKIDARRNYERTTAAYQSCLAANPSTTDACNAQRLSMGAARREYEEMTAGLTPGMVGNYHISSQ